MAASARTTAPSSGAPTLQGAFRPLPGAQAGGTGEALLLTRTRTQTLTLTLSLTLTLTLTRTRALTRAALLRLPCE